MDKKEIDALHAEIDMHIANTSKAQQLLDDHLCDEVAGMLTRLGVEDEWIFGWGEADFYTGIKNRTLIYSKDIKTLGDALRLYEFEMTVLDREVRLIEEKFSVYIDTATHKQISEWGRRHLRYRDWSKLWEGATDVIDKKHSLRDYDPRLTE